MKAPDEAAGRTDFSVVLCTRNRGSSLDRCLESLARLDYAGPWEIVVVDNGSGDRTPQILRKFQAHSVVPTTIVRREPPGLGAARNAGLSVARGALVAFTDDDCYPDPAWLGEARRVFDAHPEAGVIGGRILLFDPTDARCTIQTSERAETVPPGGFIPLGLIQGANFCVRRIVLDQIGGFDRELGAGKRLCGEDLDFFWRATMAGFEVVYDPRPLVWHHHGRKPGPAVVQINRSYALGRGAYYARGLMNRRSRLVFAKNIYWLWRMPRKHGYWRERAQELAGAGLLALTALRRPAEARYQITNADAVRR